MHFRTKLVLAHSLLVLLLTFILGVIFWNSNLQKMKQTAFQELSVLSEIKSGQLDEFVGSMHNISDFLLSDGNMLSALDIILHIERQGTGAGYVVQAKRDIQYALSTYYIEENFHRICLITEHGDFLSSRSRSNSIPDGTADVNRLQKRGEVDAAQGVSILVPPHSDPWASQEPVQVLSLVRAVLGGSQACYLEVQKPADDLDELYGVSANNDKVLALTEVGEVFYSNLILQPNDKIIAELWQNLLGQRGSASILELEDGSAAAAYYSPYSKLYTVAFRSKLDLERGAAAINRTVFTAIIAIGVISTVIIFWSSTRLTTPIRALTEKMERTTLETIEAVADNPQSKDEIETLHNAYSHLLWRISDAAKREQKLVQLQSQAEFDALQAQVNPHFLYNVLNVISNRSALNNDEVICEICNDLAAMLRYSTGTAKRLASVEEELEHTRHYLTLLQKRYGDQLDFNINVDSQILTQRIPKLTLQIIVENAVEHGFKNATGSMEIQIEGGRKENGWFILITDNGDGFEAHTLDQLQQSIQNLRIQHNIGIYRTEMELGGMGLLNTFIRLLLLYGDDLAFELGNRAVPATGAVVLIKGPFA